MQACAGGGEGAAAAAEKLCGVKVYCLPLSSVFVSTFLNPFSVRVSKPQKHTSLRRRCRCRGQTGGTGYCGAACMHATCLFKSCSASGRHMTIPLLTRATLPALSASRCASHALPRLPPAAGHTQTHSCTCTHEPTRVHTQAGSASMNMQAAAQLHTRRMQACICKRLGHAFGHTNGEADGCSRR